MKSETANIPLVSARVAAMVSAASQAINPQPAWIGYLKHQAGMPYALASCFTISASCLKIQESISANRPAPQLIKESDAEARFKSRKARWEADVRFLSDMNEICSHPAYQEIIGMGSEALPFILRELEKEPGDWFWALKAITGEDPVPADHRGNVNLMREDWLAWAQRSGMGLSFYYDTWSVPC